MPDTCVTNNHTNTEHITLLDDSRFASYFRASIRRAHTDICIAQFLADIQPDRDQQREIRDLAHSLAQAQWRGVRVRIVLSALYAGPLAVDANAAFIQFLAARGVVVRVWQAVASDCSASAESSAASRQVLHSKYALFDDASAVLGSHNLSPQAFASNRELSIATDSTQTITSLKQRFEALWSNALPASMLSGDGDDG